MRHWFAAALLIALAVGPALARTLEAEPNDTAEQAVALDEKMTLIGEFKEGRDLDYAAFEITGLRLWRLQVAGDGVSSLALYDPGGNEMVRTGADGRLTRLSNLLLPPGRYTVEIKGKAGRYLFRVIDQGPAPDAPAEESATATVAPRDPDAGPKVDEIEPNNMPADATELAFGARRTGLFDSKSDSDHYRFSLVGATRVRLSFETTDQAYIADLTRFWGAKPGPRIRIAPPDTKAHPGPLIWEGLLPTGDYLLLLRPRRVAEQPYALTLERRPFFDLPVDREPNNEGGQESPFPPDGVLEGVLSGDADFYRMPVRAAETVYSLTATGEQSFVRKLKLRMSTEVNPPAVDEWRARKWKSMRGITRVDATNWTMTIPANTEVNVALTGGIGAYRIAVERSGMAPVPPDPAVSVSIELGARRIAAFVRPTQRVDGMLSLANGSATAQNLRIEAHVENARWQVRLGQHAIELPAGATATVPITVLIGPDAWDIRPVHVSVAVFAGDRPGALATAAAEIVPDADAKLAHPGPVWTLPEAMLGGLNVGWSALGATVPKRRDALIDGLSVPGSSLRLKHKLLAKQDLIVDLAGDAPIALAGVMLSLPKGATNPDDLLHGFRVETSIDGETFHTVLTGALELHADPQGFAFDAPLKARFARLVPLTNRAASGKGSYVTIGEFRVIAVPGMALEDEPRINIADPRRGGHVVYTEPVDAIDTVLLADNKRARFRRPRGGWKSAPRMVIGFREGRAARIASLVFEEGKKPAENIAVVIVETSIDGPLGPWTALPVTWAVPPGAGRSELALGSPVWARNLRLTFPPVDASEAVRLPDILQVLERPPGPEYRSAAAEWTTQGPEAVFEWLDLAKARTLRSGPDAGDTMAKATPLPPGSPWSDTVHLGRDEDWFRIEVGEPGGSLSVALTARPTIDAVFEILNAAGRSLAAPASRVRADLLEAGVYLAPGSYFIRVREPPRSMIVTWDTSGSVSAFINQIQRGVRAFSRDLAPGRDEVNFLPFAKNPKFLLDEWTGDPATAVAALFGYDRRNMSSSNAEHSMLFASRELEGRDGVHAILVVTDLQSGGQGLNTELWQSFAKSRAKVFAMGVPTTSDSRLPRRIHEMFRDWTAPGGGYLDDLTSESRTSVAFRRAGAWLRRPATYTLETGLVLAPPEPATLEVLASPESAIAARAVEVILDGSGSMLKRLGGARRYRIARDALLALTGEVLPEGTPFALRILARAARGRAAPIWCCRLVRLTGVRWPRRSRASSRSTWPRHRSARRWRRRLAIWRRPRSIRSSCS